MFMHSLVIPFMDVWNFLLEGLHNSPRQATCCLNSWILEEQGLHVHVDMYNRVIPSQIIMLYATMSSHVEHFC